MHACVSECRNEWLLYIPSTGELSVVKDISVTIHSLDCVCMCVCVWGGSFLLLFQSYLTVWSWVSNLTSLCFRFFIYNVRIRVALTRGCRDIKWTNKCYFSIISCTFLAVFKRLLNQWFFQNWWNKILSDLFLSLGWGKLCEHSFVFLFLCFCIWLLRCFMEGLGVLRRVGG